MQRCSCLVLLASLAVCAVTYGQNLLINPGFDDPPLFPRATVTISGDVADGDTIEIDINGVNRIYEFDTNASATSGNVAVDVSAGVGKANAKAALTTAVNGDAAGPCTASDGGTDKVRLTWKTGGSCSLANTNAHDANNTISITSPFSYPTGISTLNADFPGWDDSTGSVKRNDTFGGPPCLNQSRMSYSGPNFTRYTYQTVSGLPSEQFDYTFSGQWAHTVANDNNTVTYTAEVHAGTDPNLNPLTPAPGSTGSYTLTGFAVHDWWTPFAVNVSKPAGVTALTVVLRTDAHDDWNVALHVEDTALFPTDCPILPSITDISPLFGVRNTNPLTLTINGTGFVSGSTTVKLVKSNQPDIAGTNVNVGGSGTSLTADFDLTGAALGPWTVSIAVGGCPPTVGAQPFTVILPAFSNASFELPDPETSGCPVTPHEGVPTDWLAIATVSWEHENRLNRNGWVEDATLGTLPSCPPPDGQHYGTMATAGGVSGDNSKSYQTIAVTSGATYTFSGFFAGSGNNTVTLRLREGGPNGSEIAATTVHSGLGAYDWRFASVSGSVVGNVITAEWAVQALGGGQNAAHADALVFEQCTAPINVTGVSTTPAQPMNTASANPTTLTINGTGFAGTPLVWLVGRGKMLPATVTSVSEGLITADIDLTGEESGRYAVMVKQQGCVDSYGPPNVGEPGVLVIGEFVNGGLELPDAPVNHGTCTLGDPPNQPPLPVPGLPTGWSSDAPDGGLFRDGNTPLPPNNGSACIVSTNGGHYGSMSYGGGGTMRAWQTVAVNPGVRYEFSGEFNAIPTATVTLRMLDGDENGAEIASAPVALVSNAWAPGSVAGIAPTSGVMTVVWELTVTGTLPDVGGHADGFQLASTCNDPFADADGDTDVDQADFAVFQICFTGTETIANRKTNPPPYPEYCTCFDRALSDPAVIDQADLNAFEACASGPGVPATCN